MGFTLEKQIVQHTPLVHFHAGQKGATLRGTEFKAKLDKFLIKKLGHERCRNWYFGDPKQEALDYRLTITSASVNVTAHRIVNGAEDTKNEEQYPLFFANMGEKDASKKKQFSWTNTPVNLKIFSFFPDLIETLNVHLREFLATTNFGTRQGKGFGSFYLAGENITDEQWQAWGGMAWFDVVIGERDLTAYRNISAQEGQWHFLFERIDLFYRSLRSGINGVKLNHKGYEKDFYFKSLLFKYFKDVKHGQWDKKSIKERYFRDKLGEQMARHNNPDILAYSSTPANGQNQPLIRDLMGLSSEESWKGYFDDNRDKVTKAHDDIDRFPSPLFIKPFKIGDLQYRVYLKADPIHPDFLGKTFRVDAGRSKGLKLTTPPEFNISEFLQFAFHVNLRNHVAPNLHNKTAFTALEAIYSQLRQQVPQL